MNADLSRRRMLGLLAAALPGMARAQGFAGLGTTAEGFAIPQRGRPLVFPADHGPHWAYRIEWWYLTAVLTGADGQDYGIQWTLFRSALAPEQGAGWSAPQLWMGHAGLTTATRHFSAERLARGGIGQAGVRAAPFDAWIDDWRMQGDAPAGAPAGFDELDALRVAARGPDFAYALDLVAEGPLVLHGDAGYSVKSPAGQASHYYSQPFYRVTGRLDLPQGPMPVTGQGWLDREWSSQPLAEDQAGWDWLSLVFDSGARMMAFQLRGRAPFTSGTWIAADGRTTPLPPNALRFTPLEHARVAGRRVPVRWRLDWPEGPDGRPLRIETRPLNPQSWMATSIPYWEGPLRFDGTHSGRGYLEMTGY